MTKRINFIFIATIIMVEMIFPFTGKEIMKKVYNRNEGVSVKMTIKMSLVNRMGRKRVRIISVVRKSDKNSIKSLFVFKSPSDVRGVKFLSVDYRNSDKESMRWLYLPSLKRVQRVSGSSRNDYFMGSDLTYNDLRKRNVDEEDHKLKGEKRVGEYLCWVVESIPKDDKDIYDSRINYIRKDIVFPIMVEYFNKKGIRVKIMETYDLEKIEGVWIAKRFEMENLHKNHKTLIEIKDLSVNSKIKNSIFFPARLERVKIH